MLKMRPKMIDKLSLSPPENISSEKACQLLEGNYSSYFITKSNHFNKVIVFYKGALRKSPTLLALHTEPRNSISGTTKIELNPTHFESNQKMMLVLGKLIDPAFAKVTRLDCTVDVELPIEKVNRQLLVQRKRARSDFDEGGRLTGVTYGKLPEVLCIYDKASKEKLPTPLTRLELKQFKHKIPIGTLAELGQLKTFCPFAKFKFIDTKNPNELTRGKQIKASFLREMVDSMGATGAMKYLNTQHNFNRNFGNVLTTSIDVPNLDMIFQRNLELFFKEDLNGN